jgi:hypothetical protein
VWNHRAHDRTRDAEDVEYQSVNPLRPPAIGGGGGRHITTTKPRGGGGVGLVLCWKKL